MQNRLKVLIGIIAVAVVLVAGASVLMRSAPGKDMTNGATADGQTGSGASRNATGSGAVVVTDGKIPDGWPADIPVYEGATVEYSGTGSPAQGKTGMVLVISSTDDFNAIVDFYTKEMAAQGWTLMRTLKNENTTVLLGTKDARVLSVAMAAGKGKTTITLGAVDQ